jgi:hypothetical protein
MGRSGLYQSKPRGFNVLSRIVIVHAAFSLAILLSALMQSLGRGSVAGALFAGAGILIAVGGCVAMVGVAKQRSSRALDWLRWLLWITVAKVPLGMLSIFADSDGAAVASLHVILINEAVLIPLAIYWSRPVHGKYLAA